MKIVNTNCLDEKLYKKIQDLLKFVDFEKEVDEHMLKEEVVRFEDFFGSDSIWLLKDNRFYFSDRNCGFHEISKISFNNSNEIKNKLLKLFQN